MIADRFSRPSPVPSSKSPLLILSWVVSCFAAQLAPASSFQLTNAGALSGLDLGQKLTGLSAADGGFFAYDVTAQKPLVFTLGSVRPQDGGTVFDSDEIGGLRLHVSFVEQPGYVLVTGRLENSVTGDRAIILDYRIGLPAGDAVLSTSLNAAQDRVLGAPPSEIEASAFPLAAVATGGKTIALALPPDEPRIFGLIGRPHSLGARFYLGLSPLPSRFPNQATFSFIIYQPETGWGFRAALESYYRFFPARYSLRTRRDGLWMFQVKGLVPENIGQYGFNVLEIQNKDVGEGFGSG